MGLLKWKVYAIFFSVKNIDNYFLKNNALTCTPTHSMRFLASTHPGQHWGLANAKSMPLIALKVASHFYYEGYHHSICLFFMFVCHSHLFFCDIPVYILCPVLYFLKYFFWCGLSLKSSLNLSQYCFCFMFCFLAGGMWDFSSPTRDGTRTPCFGRQSPNHWTTREVP